MFQRNRNFGSIKIVKFHKHSLVPKWCDMIPDDAVAAVRQLKLASKLNRKRPYSELEDQSGTRMPAHSGQPMINKINERYTILLKDGVTAATVYPILSPLDIPIGLLHFYVMNTTWKSKEAKRCPFLIH